MTLGVYPTMTIEEARQKAAEARQSCRAGVDPRKGTVRDRSMWKVRRLFDEYVEEWCRVKHRSDDT